MQLEICSRPRSASICSCSHSTTKLKKVAFGSRPPSTTHAFIRTQPFGNVYALMPQPPFQYCFWYSYLPCLFELLWSHERLCPTHYLFRFSALYPLSIHDMKSGVLRPVLMWCKKNLPIKSVHCKIRGLTFLVLSKVCEGT